MRRAVAVAGVLFVASGTTMCMALTGAPAVSSPAPGWADIRADVEVLAAAAGSRPGADFATADAPAERADPRSPRAVAGVMGRLDGVDDAGAAGAAWRALFGTGAAALAPGPRGGPVTVERFADAKAGERFVRRRLARARAAVQGRKGPAPGAAALHEHLREAAETVAAPRSPDVGTDAPARCGPVRIRASGDTAALAGLCADLETYWGQDGTEAEVVQVDARRTGPLPRAERDMTATASVVDRAAREVEALAAPTGRAGGDVTPSAVPEPFAAADPPPPAPSQHDGGEAGAVHHRDAQPDPEQGPTPELPGPEPAAAASPAGAEPTREAGADRIAPVLAAARRPRNWMTAAGGVVALASGVSLVRRVRERRWAVVS